MQHILRNILEFPTVIVFSAALSGPVASCETFIITVTNHHAIVKEPSKEQQIGVVFR